MRVIFEKGGMSPIGEWHFGPYRKLAFRKGSCMLFSAVYIYSSHISLAKCTSSCHSECAQLIISSQQKEEATFWFQASGTW